MTPMFAGRDTWAPPYENVLQLLFLCNVNYFTPCKKRAQCNMQNAAGQASGYIRPVSRAPGGVGGGVWHTPRRARAPHDL